MHVMTAEHYIERFGCSNSIYPELDKDVQAQWVKLRRKLAPSYADKPLYVSTDGSIAVESYPDGTLYAGFTNMGMATGFMLGTVDQIKNTLIDLSQSIPTFEQDNAVVAPPALDCPHRYGEDFPREIYSLKSDVVYLGYRDRAGVMTWDEYLTSLSTKRRAQVRQKLRVSEHLTFEVEPLFDYEIPVIAEWMQEHWSAQTAETCSTWHPLVVEGSLLPLAMSVAAGSGCDTIKVYDGLRLVAVGTFVKRVNRRVFVGFFKDSTYDAPNGLGTAVLAHAVQYYLQRPETGTAIIDTTLAADFVEGHTYSQYKRPVCNDTMTYAGIAICSATPKEKMWPPYYQAGAWVYE